uniref:F-box protein At2g02240-like n=1 Tax=Nicotiana sylvestris TaxID=4096 RepID=A0A1U7X0Z3_NICSY|nr:PREDICTED: F-box protein At2g02240-like [Nicotiana sylvestris]
MQFCSACRTCYQLNHVVHCLLECPYSPKIWLLTLLTYDIVAHFTLALLNFVTYFLSIHVDTNQSFSLEKWNGKRCYMLAARSLKIVWGVAPTYWRWISFAESRYAAYLIFTTKFKTYGFGNQPAESSVRINGHDRETQTIYLDPQGG